MAANTLQPGGSACGHGRGDRPLPATARRPWAIGLNQSLPVLAPCSLGCSGTARYGPALAGTSRHDRPRRAPPEGPTGALPMIGRFPPQLLQTGQARDDFSSAFPQAAAWCRRQLPRSTRPIRGSARSLLTSGRCQRAPLAQLAEQRTLNPRVRGSSPWRRTPTVYCFGRCLTDRLRLMLDSVSADA